MGLIFKIAFRNILRHKGKSGVIGTILFIGAMVMTLGNGVITGTREGIDRNLIGKVVGNITVLSARQTEDQILGIKPMKIIGNYEGANAVLEAQKYIDSFLPITRGLAVALNLSTTYNDSSEPEVAVLFGVDFQKYQAVFEDNVEIVEGEPLKQGEKGFLLNIKGREAIYDMQNVWIIPQGYPLAKQNLTPEAATNGDTLQTRDNMVLLGMGDGDVASDIRLSVKGVFKFKNLNEVLHLLNLVDLESFRECFGYVTDADKQVELSPTDQRLLNASEENLEDLFSGQPLSETQKPDASTDDLRRLRKPDSVKTGTPHLDAGAYNIVMVKLKKGYPLDKAVDALNAAFHQAGVDSDVRAVSWEKSFGYLADMILFFRIALSMLVNFIFFVAVVVIMNTLSMAAVERTYEVGMMRAIGAGKGFIGKVFFTETALLALVFGGLGMAAGVGIVKLMAMMNIPATGEVMTLVFGGDTFCPIVDANGIVTGAGQIAIVALISMVYPLILISRITPLDAINRD